jgi:hypothetical protein
MRDGVRHRLSYGQTLPPIQNRKGFIMDIEMELSRIVIQENTDQQIIVLKEKNGERSFAIVIGMAEAYAIHQRLKGFIPPRPLTHDLVHNVITDMGGHLERIVINDLQDHTFFALLVIRNRQGQIVEVDTRPSDAIALVAGNGETPIFVAEHVLEEVS